MAIGRRRWSRLMRRMVAAAAVVVATVERWMAVMGETAVMIVKFVRAVTGA